MTLRVLHYIKYFRAAECTTKIIVFVRACYKYGRIQDVQIQSLIHPRGRCGDPRPQGSPDHRRLWFVHPNFRQLKKGKKAPALLTFITLTRFESAWDT